MPEATEVFFLLVAYSLLGGGREGRGPLSFHINFHPLYSQNQANTSVNLIIKCFCKGTSPAKHGYKEIY